MTLDLTQDAGVDLLRRLLETADVLLENFTPESWSSSGSAGTQSTTSTRR